MTLRYLSVCSGIEAATAAWHSLGWEPVAFAEIEAFPSAVLKHHYPKVPNLGDFTKIEASDVGSIDLLVGGTPCQSFSVAGLRGGLADDRGNLALEFLRLADRTRPKWLVWENVPGVLSSNGGRDFGSILGGLVELGYGFAYRVLDAQHFGVPQRRRRVFVVGYLGDWRRAAAVLFERHGLQGHSPPRRKTGERVAPTIASRPSGGGGLGTDFDCDGGLIAGTLGQRTCDHTTGIKSESDFLVVRCVTARQTRLDAESETFVTHPLRGDGFDASEDGTARGTLLIAFDTTQITSKENRCQPRAGEPCHPLAAGAHPPAIAFSSKDHGADAGHLAPTLRAGGHSKSHANAGVPPAVAFTTSEQSNGFAWERDVWQTLDAQVPNDTSNVQKGLRIGAAVRRVTPAECEALQGFRRNYTLIPYRGKPASDGPRYKALGNSMAVPVMRWIGERIAMVEARA